MHDLCAPCPVLIDYGTDPAWRHPVHTNRAYWLCSVHVSMAFFTDRVISTVKSAANFLA